MSKLDSSDFKPDAVRTIVNALKNMPEYLAQRRVEREEKWRMEFQNDLPYKNWRLDNNRYSPEPIQIMWEGYKMRCENREKAFSFMGAEIRLPADELKRAHAVEELGVVFACYITQLLATWPKDHARMNSVFLNIERMCIGAYSVLNEDEFHDFSSRLIDKDFVAKKRF